MEKRLPLALFLSFLVLFGWTLMQGPAPERTPPGAAGQPSPAEGSDPPPKVEDTEEPEPFEPVGALEVAAEEEVTGPIYFGEKGEPGYVMARFSNRGARLVELDLRGVYDRVGLSEAEKEEPQHWLGLLEAVDTGEETTGSLVLSASASAADLVREPLETALWNMELLEEGGAPVGVEFSLAPGTGVRFVKRFRFIEGTHRIAVELELENLALDKGRSMEFVLRPAACVPAELNENVYREPKAVAAGPATAEDLDDLELESEERSDDAKEIRGTLRVDPPLEFVGVHNKYFAVLLRGSDEKSTNTLRSASWVRIPDAAWKAANPNEKGRALHYIVADVNLDLRLPPRGETERYEYVLYAGPKDRKTLIDDHPSHELVVDADLRLWIITPIARAILVLLNLLHSLTGNWGVAIILMTMLVRALLFPLNRRMQTSMAVFQKKMKRVQPKIDELKKKYEKDPQKLRQEQAKLMQAEGAFPPLGGCLPVFLQIPIFFGLFSAIRTSYDLRQASFAGWIDDLSRPDRLLTLDLALPFGFQVEYLNLLPILMVVLWVLHTMTMPKPADENQARVQRMMMFMPIFMGFFLYNYASGLSLYMITQSGLGIFEQLYIKKKWPIDDTDKPKKPGAGCGPFSGVMQNLAEKQKEHMKRLEAMQAQQRKQTSKARKKRR